MPCRDDAHRLRLLSRLGRRHVVVTEPLTICGKMYDFKRVSDPRTVLDAAIAAEDRGQAARMPYWAELWESAIAVGEWLHEHAAEVQNRNVLDLGCGMGLTGTVAAALGGRVLLADLETDALLFARLNAWRWRARVRARRVNWQTDHLDERFDLIIGADVLYERGQRDFLEPFWREHLASGGKVILGEPGRQSGDEFPAWIRSKGWKFEQEERLLAEQGKSIRIFTLAPEQDGLREAE